MCMNVYFVQSSNEHTYISNSCNELFEPCIIADLICAETRGKARYLVWKKHQDTCYTNNFWEEQWKCSRIVARNVKGPERIIEALGDPLSYLWRALCEEHWGEVCTPENHPMAPEHYVAEEITEYEGMMDGLL